MKIFISWSKDAAKDIALSLHEWLPKVTLNHVKTWCSADIKCLPHGSGYPEAILAASRDCDACLVILTRENLSGWWVNFEAGLFIGQKKKVFAILCGDLSHHILASHNHPLSVTGMNYTSISAESLSSFLTSLKSDDREWMENDFATLVENSFSTIQDKYNSIFTEDYVKLSNLLSKDKDKDNEI